VSSEIQELLTLARQKCDAGHLVSPPGDNALELYKEVLARDPDNAEALEALVDIKGRLAALIESREPVTDTKIDLEQREEAKPLTVPAIRSAFDLKRTRSPVVAWIGSAAVVLSVAAVVGAFYLRSSDAPKPDAVSESPPQNAATNTKSEPPSKIVESGEISRPDASLGFKSSLVPKSEPEQTETDKVAIAEVETGPEIATVSGSPEQTSTTQDSSEQESIAMVEQPVGVPPFTTPASEMTPSETQQSESDDGSAHEDESADTSLVEDTPSPSTTEQTVLATEVRGDEVVEVEPDDTSEEVGEADTKEETKVEEVTEVQNDEFTQPPLTIEKAIQDLEVNGDDRTGVALIEAPDEQIEEDSTEAETTQPESDQTNKPDLVQQKSEASAESTDVTGEQSSLSEFATGQPEKELIPLPAVPGAQDEPALAYENEEQPVSESQQMAEADTEQVESDVSETDKVVVAAILESDGPGKTDLEKIKDAPELDQSTTVEDEAIPDESALESDDETAQGVDDIENASEQEKQDTEIEILEDLRGAQLIAAIKSERMEQLSELLAAGAYVDAVDAQGDNALIYAAWDGKNDIVRYLIARGANVNHKNRMGWTALLSAVTSGHLDTVRLLISSGADIHVTSQGGKTALMAAARNGRLEIAHRLLNSGVDVNQTNDEGWTALFYAVWYGHENVVAKLLEYGADVSIRDNTGTDVETVARNRGYKELVKMLVESA
jgi:ankyrin repeat protein